MTDARDDALETPSGEPLDTDPDPDPDGDASDGREPYDADGFVEPERHDPTGDDDYDDADEDPTS